LEKIILIIGFPASIWELIKNPVFTSMVIGWMFGSFLVGGYATYLPKYIETQYGRSASAADFYAGI
jgi:organic anion transporter 4C